MSSYQSTVIGSASVPNQLYSTMFNAGAKTKLQHKCIEINVSLYTTVPFTSSFQSIYTYNSISKWISRSTLTMLIQLHHQSPCPPARPKISRRVVALVALAALRPAWRKHQLQPATLGKKFCFEKKLWKKWMNAEKLGQPIGTKNAKWPILQSSCQSCDEPNNLTKSPTQSFCQIQEGWCCEIYTPFISGMLTLLQVSNHWVHCLREEPSLTLERISSDISIDSLQSWMHRFHILSWHSAHLLAVDFTQKCKSQKTSRSATRASPNRQLQSSLK